MTSDVQDEPVPAAPGGPAAWPRRLHSPRREWFRRFVIAAALALGVWLLVIAANRSEHGLEQGSSDPVVVERFPLPDAQAPSQSQVGVVLQPGYDGTLFINGTRVPEAELDGAQDPTEMDPKDLERYGVRPNNRHRLYFTPGRGKVFDELPKGKAVVTVQYHKDRQPGVDTGTVSWTITVQ